MRILGILVVLCFASSTARADQLSDILAKNLAARGGADKLRAKSSLRLTGKAVLGGGDFTLEAAWGTVQTRSGKVRSELTVQGLTQVSAYDGKQGWNVRPFGGRRDAEQASEDDVRSLAQDADIDGPLIDWRAKGHTVEYLGNEDVDGTPAIKLRVKRKD